MNSIFESIIYSFEQNFIPIFMSTTGLLAGIGVSAITCDIGQTIYGKLTSPLSTKSTQTLHLPSKISKILEPIDPIDETMIFQP